MTAENKRLSWRNIFEKSTPSDRQGNTDVSRAEG